MFVSGCESSNNSNNSNNKEKDTKLNVYLFHWEQCSHCKDEIAWLETIRDTNNINVIYYEVTEYSSLVSEVRSELGITDEYIPLTVIGTEYYVGFSGAIKTKIMDLINKYNDTDHCDVVDLVVKGKDTTDCYIKNNEIN